MCTSRPGVWPSIAASLLCFLQAEATGSALQLEPVSLRLSTVERAAVLRLRNHGGATVHVQVRAFRWEQVDGDDRLTATDELRISPPIQAIAPGAEQLVRVLLAEDAAPAAEATFRLVVDELPNVAATVGKVQMLLRYSVPVSVRPDADPAPSRLEFLLGDSNGRAVLQAINSGGQSARLSDVYLVTANGDDLPVGRGLFGYVLAGRVRRWDLGSAADVAIDQIASLRVDTGGAVHTYPLEFDR